MVGVDLGDGDGSQSFGGAKSRQSGQRVVKRQAGVEMWEVSEWTVDRVDYIDVEVHDHRRVGIEPGERLRGSLRWPVPHCGRG